MQAQRVIPSDVGSIIFVRWHPDGQRILMVGKDSAASLWGDDGSGPLVRYVLGEARSAWRRLPGFRMGRNCSLVTMTVVYAPGMWRVERFSTSWSVILPPLQKVLVYDGEDRFLSVGKEDRASRQPGQCAPVGCRQCQGNPDIERPRRRDRGCDLGPRSERICLCGRDGVMRLYTTAAQLEIPAIQAAQGRVLSAGWIDGESRILTAGGNTAAIWDAQNGEPIFKPSHDEQIWSVRLGDDGRLLMAASDERSCPHLADRQRKRDHHVGPSR